MINITYFVHGTTTDNEKNLASGWSDVELSELGIRQSMELKALISQQHFDAVFSSDLKRAMDSAKLVFSETVPIFHDPRLRECNYGELDGYPTAIVEPLQEKAIILRFPDGESYKDVKSRITEFLQFLKLNHDGKHIAIVAHKAPQLALDVLLKGRTWEEAFAQDWRKTKSWQPGWKYILA